MMTFILLIMMSTMMSAILMMLMSLLSPKFLLLREKMTPFECGFDPLFKARLPFSLRFFLIGVLFIVFDVELALILPSPLLYQMSNTHNFLLMVLVFLSILLMGLTHEWNEGSLLWIK